MIKPSVLIVEPDSESQKSIGAMLASAHIDFEIVGTGSHCLKKLSQKDYYCVVLEFDLGDVEAFTLVRNIRLSTNNQKVCIIGMTADVGRINREKCLENGIDAYFAKPMIPESLVDILTALNPAEEKPKTMSAGTVN